MKPIDHEKEKNEILNKYRSLLMMANQSYLERGINKQKITIAK